MPRRQRRTTAATSTRVAAQWADQAPVAESTRAARRRVTPERARRSARAAGHGERRARRRVRADCARPLRRADQVRTIADRAQDPPACSARPTSSHTRHGSPRQRPVPARAALHPARRRAAQRRHEPEHPAAQRVRVVWACAVAGRPLQAFAVSLLPSLPSRSPRVHRLGETVAAGRQAMDLRAVIKPRAPAATGAG